MVKRLLTFIVIGALFIPAMAWATDPMQAESDLNGNTRWLGDDLAVTASLKTWYVNIDFTSGNEASSMMFGPSINVTFKNRFYAGMNYYTGSGFDYDSGDVETEDGYVITNIKGDVTKTDVDLWGGYIFHPRASVFIGYKYSKLEDEQKGEVEFSDTEVSSDIEATLSGPVIGISGNYPIGNSGFVLFGTLGYGFLNYEQDTKFKVSNSTDSLSESGDGSGDLDGFALEFGASYAFSRFPRFSLTGGYKYQSYVDENDDDLTFSGLTFGANYRF